MSDVDIVIVDYGIGNLRSVQKAFERAGASAAISDSPSDIAAADALVLPGVGAFQDAMTEIHARGLVTVLRKEVAEKRKPLLGICLGMQLIARSSTEGGECDGLGLIPATVERLDIEARKNWAGRKITLPHIGWNAVHPESGSRLFADIPSESDFYFVHSFHVVCDRDSMAAATCDYGLEFTCAIEHENIFAAQFHPEKSQHHGTKLIENYIHICAESRGSA